MNTEQNRQYQTERRDNVSERDVQSFANAKGRVPIMIRVIGFLGSKWILGICFVLLLLIGLALGQETYRKYLITQEIQEQRSAIQHLERGNQDLSDYVQYLQTDNYRERVARERLGKKREGEHVVVVPEEYSDPITSSEEQSLPLTNPQKWWNYFFGAN